MWTFQLFWTLSSFLVSNAQAYYEPGSYRYFPYRSQSPEPIISIDLNPHHLLDASFRVAAREGRIQDVIQDLKEGADINSKSDAGRTALMFAARSCYIPVARTLIAHDADVNIRDGEGDSALVYATLESCLPVVKLLLRKPGIQLSLRDDEGKTVMDYAVDCASLDVDGPAAQILDLLKKKEKIR